MTRLFSGVPNAVDGAAEAFWVFISFRSQGLIYGEDAEVFISMMVKSVELLAFIELQLSSRTNFLISVSHVDYFSPPNII